VLGVRGAVSLVRTIE
jgi:hypothetical protein